MDPGFQKEGFWELSESGQFIVSKRQIELGSLVREKRDIVRYIRD